MQIKQSFFLQAIASGSKEAFEMMFREYYPKVCGMLSSIVKDDYIVEKIAQDLFLNLWVNKERLGDISSFDDYMYICTRNAAVAQLKAEMKKRPCEKKDFTNLSENTTERDVLMDELYAVVRSEMDKMPPQRKRVFEMSRMEGLSTAQISQQLNISPRTVERHLSLALKSLRKIEYAVLLLLI